MRKLSVLFVALIVAACGGGATATPGASGEPAPSGGGAAVTGTVRILIHQNPPLVAFMEEFNKKFEAANPGVTVDMSVVKADELTTSVQTRLTANDVDVVVPTLTGFSGQVQPYMENVLAPAWQQLIDAGLLLDSTSPTRRSSGTTTPWRSRTP